jgi:hypothetical protein
VSRYETNPPGDQQHHRHGAQQHDECEPHVADRAVLQRLHHDGYVGVGIGEVALERRRDRRHFLLRRIGADAVSQSADAVEINASPPALRVVVAHGQPEACASRKVEAAWRDADNRRRHAADLNRLRQNVGPPAQTLLPEPVADDHRTWTAGAVLVGGELASHDRRRAEDLEETRRHAADRDDVGFALIADHRAAA